MLYYRLPLKRCRSGVVRVVALAGQIYFTVLATTAVCARASTKKATREASVTAASAPSRLFVIEHTQNGLAEQ